MTDLAMVVRQPGPDLHATPLEVLRAMPLAALRVHRQELLAECARAARWRRLVQARLDLAVDVAAPVEDLHRCPQLRAVVGGGHAGAVHADLQVLEPTHPGDPNGDPVAVLRRVEAARAELTAYAEALAVQLEAATGELVVRYAREPGTCLVALT